MKTKESSASFFFKHAGFSFNPKNETEAKARRRCARELAQAERWAIDVGLSFEWEQDDTTNREWTDDGAEYYTHKVSARNASGAVTASLCGVDFGEGGEPWGNPNRRVVEAELACESMKQTRRGFPAKLGKENMPMKTEKQPPAEEQAKTQSESILEMVQALHTGTDAEQETGLQAIQESPLCIEVRSGWYPPGSSETGPAEYSVLLCTGGPAVRLRGDLNEHNEPENARLEFQDWGTPWTPFNVRANFGGDADKISAALLEYAQQFYFGD